MRDDSPFAPVDTAHYLQKEGVCRDWLLRRCFDPHCSLRHPAIPDSVPANVFVCLDDFCGMRCRHHRACFALHMSLGRVPALSRRTTPRSAVSSESTDPPSPASVKQSGVLTLFGDKPAL